jgi:hypothetical protein
VIGNALGTVPGRQNPVVNVELVEEMPVKLVAEFGLRELANFLPTHSKPPQGSIHSSLH